MPQVSIYPIDQIPKSAARVLEVLESSGYEAWLVGGWVRDMLRGVAAHDVDICTNALWQESKAVFVAAGIPVHETGTAHGTLTVVVDGHAIEVTTYRKDGTYSDARHPDSVTFVSSIQEDLARRDFTINALAWHPKRGLLDAFGGIEDLRCGLIRAVGDPHVRFEEDALRILRALRFASRFGYTIEPNTQAAMRTNAYRLDAIARERIGAELDGIVNSGHLGWALRAEADIMCRVIPSLEPLRGFEQKSPYHCFDIYEHTVRVCEGIEFYTGGCASKHLRWAALLHDVGKAATFFTDEHGHGHFYGHPHEGACITQSYLKSLALPHDFIRTVVTLVRLHDRPMSAELASELSLLRDIDERNKSKNRFETLGLMHEMLDLRRADALAKSVPCRTYATELNEHETLLRKLKDMPVCWRSDELAISGKDLIAQGIAPGPELGELLNSALEAVIQNKVPNNHETLLAFILSEH